MIKEISSVALSALLLAPSFSAEAQQAKKIPRIGYLTGSSLSAAGARTAAFHQGLREVGYVEGTNIFIEWRSWEGKLDRQSVYAGDLARLKVDVIVAVGAGDIRAAKEATATIPIVMINGGDAVGSGFVASLARPSGNVTGLSTFAPELSGKRVELLKEIVPKLSRAAVFMGGGTISRIDREQIKKEIDIAAAALGVKLQYLDSDSLKDIETAFQAVIKARVEGVAMEAAGPILIPHRTKIVELALKSRLPTIYRGAEEVEAGGLISYGVNFPDLYRRAAIYVDKILKGAKPADLPVEQPTKFEFVINLKTAKQIGLTIPPNVLARADKVIK